MNILEISRKNIAAIDIGNSRIKVKIDKDIYAFDHSMRGWDNQFRKVFIESGSLPVCGISSVNDDVKVKVIMLLGEIGIKDILFDKDLLANQKTVKFNHIQGIGYDRVFGLIGAMKHADAPLITIDCGTAITINAIDSKGIFLGGTIFPGVNTQIRALAENADKLMEVDLNGEISPLGKNTADALRSGIILGVTGSIKEILRLISEEVFHFYKTKIFITGGSAEILLPRLNQQDLIIEYRRGLVVEGIYAVLKEIYKENQ